MNSFILKIIFAVAYFGILAWTFKLGRTSVFDDWFNDTSWEKKYIDINGNELTHEEMMEKLAEERQRREELIDDITDEDQMVALLALLDQTKVFISQLEEKNIGLRKKARSILNKRYKEQSN